jgi:hypothetical protein
MLIAVFDYGGVVYHAFIPRGETVNKEYCLEVLKSLREAVRKKRPDSWMEKNGCFTMAMHRRTRRC